MHRFANPHPDSTRRMRRPWRPKGTIAGVVLLCLAGIACVDTGDDLAKGGDVGTGDEPAAIEVPALYAREIEAWRVDRHQRLLRSDSWLSLAGLAWLREGENTCGSDRTSDVVFPPPAPARIGVLRMTGGEVEFEASPGVTILSRGEPVTRCALTSDADGAPTVLELGSLLFHLIRRGDRLAVRLKDRENPALREFRGIDYYRMDPAWRVEGRFEVYDPPKPIPFPTVMGTTSNEPSPGAVVFQAAGGSHRLDVLHGAEEDEIFIIFGDPTNGKQTYGGGRFLYAEAPGDDGRVVLDFNKAYNPPCAFTPFATCPLPPTQNRLTVAVRAGEKSYGDGHH